MDDKDLDQALGQLPRRGASPALRRRLEERWLPPARRRTRGATWVGAATLLVILVVLGAAMFLRGGERQDPMLREAVNDHLRLLYAEHPLEVESGGIHQVKPWFAGRLDFAPVLRFEGDADFPLRGGAVAYFLDRKAATFVFARRLHTVSLFVFREEGLPWPRGSSDYAGASRGFHARLWKDKDLGYALVSDAADVELADLEQRIRSAP